MALQCLVDRKRSIDDINLGRSSSRGNEIGSSEQGSAGQT